MKALNVEGAAVMGDKLWLLQRGNSEQGANVVVSLRALRGARLPAARSDAGRAGAARHARLRSRGLEGAALTFSDASPRRRVARLSASAEASPESREDEAILGSVVGTIDRGGEVRRLRTIDRKYKVEGVHAALDTGVVTMTFVCDQDDPESTVAAALRDDAGRSAVTLGAEVPGVLASWSRAPALLADLLAADAEAPPSLCACATTSATRRMNWRYSSASSGVTFSSTMRSASRMCSGSWSRDPRDF